MFQDVLQRMLQLYMQKISVNFLSLFIKKDEKKIDIDWSDEIINAVVLTYNGELKLEGI